MRSGALRHLVTIQSLVPVQDVTTGDISQTWVPFATDWRAEIHPLSGREFLAAGAEQSEVVARIVIRYLAGVKNSMRVLHGSQIFNIIKVLPDQKSGIEYLTLMVSEVTQE